MLKLDEPNIGRNIALTFLVGVNGSDVPFKVFSTMEALATTLDCTYVQSVVFLIRVGTSRLFGRYSSASALLGQIRNRSRQGGARPRQMVLWLI